MSRNASIDHIRIVLTGLVIVHHSAIVYGGAGGWYWREQPDSSNLFLLGFNAVNQSFFMGFFFLLAGYYTPGSFDRKGAKRFITERLARLGIPLLAYFFILAPLTIAIANTHGGTPFWSGWWQATKQGEFEPGPLWFAEALLIFAFAYIAWRKIKSTTREGTSAVPNFRSLALIAFGIGIVSFAVRLAFPTGEAIAWLQVGYFPCYIFLFIAGCAASRSKLLDNVTSQIAQPWMIISCVTIISLPFILATRLNAGSFSGGWTLNALYYALWNPFTAWGIILGMLWFFRQYWSKESALTAWLARRAYGAYIIHPPIIVALSLAIAPWDGVPLLKFAAVGSAACIGSFLSASALLAIPGAKCFL